MFDRERFSAIAHQHRAFCSPLSGPRVDRFIDRLSLPAGARVLDIGCGKGAFLFRVLRRYDAHGTGIDASPSFVAEAQTEAAHLGLAAPRLMLHEQDASIFALPFRTLDLAICIGSTHIYGDLRATLERLASSVRPGGLLVAGDLFWEQTAPPDQLAAFGMAPDQYADYARTVDTGMQLGLTPLSVQASTRDEFDDYEWQYAAAVEEWAAAHPDDPAREAFLQRGRFMRDTYLAWRRAALGFALLCYRVP